MTVRAREETPRALESAAGGLRRRHVLDLDDFSREEVELVLRTAAAMKGVLRREIKKVPTLRGRVIITLFYEVSTRTRVSFEEAGKVLSADVINMQATGSSVEKGESLLNTALTLQAMGVDLIVVRHPHSGAPYFMARHLERSGVINAGDGLHAHPTQALLDLYTIQERLGSLEGRKVVIVGDVLHSRVARSDLWGLTALGARVVLCGPPTLLPLELLRPPPGYPSPREYPLARVEVETDLDRACEGADVVMALRLQLERQAGGRAAPLPGDAPRPHERGGGDQPRAGPWGAVGHRGAGDQRCGGAHGAALPAVGAQAGAGDGLRGEPPVVPLTKGDPRGPSPLSRGTTGGRPLTKGDHRG